MLDFPPKIISISQLPNSVNYYITLQWVIEARRGDLPLLGFHIEEECYSKYSMFIPLSRLTSTSSNNKDNSSVFRYSIISSCRWTSGAYVSVEIKSLNSHQFSQSLYFKAKYNFIGMKFKKIFYYC